MSEIRKFLTYPVVIDWLQWGEFPEKLGDIDCPQITLSLIKEYREHIEDLEAQLTEKEKRIEKLEAGLKDVEMSPRILHKDTLVESMQAIAREALAGSEGE